MLTLFVPSCCSLRFRGGYDLAIVLSLFLILHIYNHKHYDAIITILMVNYYDCYSYYKLYYDGRDANVMMLLIRAIIRSIWTSIL